MPAQELYTHLPSKCCQNGDNHDVEQLGGGFSVRTCRICGAKHHELVVDPGKYAVKVMSTK